LGTGPAHEFILKNLEPGGPENVKNRVWNWTGGSINLFYSIEREPEVLSDWEKKLEPRPAVLFNRKK
jgi:hypothetical protein